MYPDEFDYYRADSVDEALSLLEEHDDAEFIAGGHSLLPTMKSGLATPDALVDIGSIPGIDGIDVDGDTVTVGALMTYAELLEADIGTALPAFVEAAGEIGDVQVRNAGTVGGNLAHADPASDLPAAALAADATIHAAGPDGERTVPVDEFFIAPYATALGEHELLTRVELPVVEAGAGAYAKKASPSSGYAMVGVAVRLAAAGGVVDDARVAATGAVDHAMRLGTVEDALEGVSLGADAGGIAADAAEGVTDGVEPWQLMDDLQASAEFREQLLEVYAGRAIERALDDAAPGGGESERPTAA